MIQQAALVALGGAIGAVLRFGIGNIIESSEFPLSTIIVNVSGSFILGMLAVMAINNGYSEELMLFFGTGLLGAFTTMSTFSLETLTLVKNDNYTLALVYACISFILCILFAFVGWELGDRLEIG
ncbi:MAG: fluoride efflux transporter CrcB [Candidatus Poseidoniaceae archaeon]|nr:fluoride efflux transporter CrcB [Candidatus Poseidoniaceae archaeon]